MARAAPGTRKKGFGSSARDADEIRRARPRRLVAGRSGGKCASVASGEPASGARGLRRVTDQGIPPPSPLDVMAAGPSRGAVGPDLGAPAPRAGAPTPAPPERSGNPHSASRLAYQQFADDIRAGVIATEGGLVSTPDVARAVERVIGERWTRLTDAERDALVAKAQAHQRDVLEGRLVPAPPRVEPAPAPVPDPNPDVRPASAPTDGTTPKRRVSANLTLDGPSTAKRKRGRPPKTAAPAETAVPVAPVDPPLVPASRSTVPSSVFIGEAPTVPGLHSVPHPGGVLRGARVVDVDTTDGPGSDVPPGGERLVGTAVEGIVDGAFDAGYLVTARVGNNLFRGCLWREDEPPR